MKHPSFRTFVTALLLAGVTTANATPQTTGEATRLALVASEADGIVVVIDLNTEQVGKTLATGKVPHAMAIAPGGKIFVNNRGTKELTILDGIALEVAGAVPLPATSFQLALSPDGKTLAVAYKDALNLSLVDVATNTVVKTIEVGKPPEGEFKGVMMKHPYWSPDGQFVYVADAVNKVIVKIDVAQGAVAKVLNIDGVNHYLHPSPDGKLLYAVNEKRGGGASLTLIDAATDAIVKDLPVALTEGEKGLGHHGAFTSDGRHFLYCNEGGQYVSVLDVAKQAWMKTIKTGKGPGHAALSPDGKQFFIVHHNDSVITVIDAARMEAVKDIKIGDSDKQAHAAWFTPDGKFFYVVATGDKALVKVDVASREVVSKMPVGEKSFFFAIKDGQTFPATEY
jgi:YVTN family beta-propeller protein